MQRASHESKKLIKLQTIVSDVLSFVGTLNNRISKKKSDEISQFDFTPFKPSSDEDGVKLIDT